MSDERPRDRDTDIRPEDEAARRELGEHDPEHPMALDPVGPSDPSGSSVHGGGAASSPGADERFMGRAVAGGLLAGLVVAVILGWIPLLGGLLAGFAAGYVARTRSRGLYASFIPGIVAMAWYWLVTYLPELPFPWAQALTETLAPMNVLLAGASAIVFSLILMGQFLFAILGGWFGGMMQERRHPTSTATWRMD
jgi:hypothetical protein